MTRQKVAVTLVFGLLIAAVPLGAHAQVEELLSSYTGANGVAYMDPLKDAIGNNLSDGLYISGRVPKDGLHARLDVKAMVVKFDDEDRVFTGMTETFESDGTEVPTIIGDTSSVRVEDPGGSGAAFIFPGGFDIGSFALAVPQLTIGSIAGTEAIVRYVAVNVNDDDEDNELGDVSLLGIGGRHSLSQYFESLPFDAAAMFMYQRLELGEDDFLVAQSQSYGVQLSRRFSLLEPYGGLAMESFDMDVNYKTDFGGEEQEIDLDFDRETTAHLTAGLAAHLGFLHLNGEVNIASQTSFAFGLGLGL